MSASDSPQQTELLRLQEINIRLMAYQAVNEKLFGVTSIEQVAAIALPFLLDLFGAEAGAILLAPGLGQSENCVLVSGFPTGEWTKLPLPFRRRLLEKLLQKEAALGGSGGRGLLAREGLPAADSPRNFLALPLTCGEDCRGGLILFNFFHPEHLNLYLTDAANLLSPIVSALTRVLLLETRARETKLLETILDNATNAVAYLDRDFNLLQVNQAFVEGAGIPRKELLHKNLFAERSLEEWRSAAERVREEGEPISFRETPYLARTRPQRGVTYWDWTLAPLKGEQGSVEGFVLTLTDMTAQVRVRDQMAAAQRLLEAIVENTEAHLVYLDRDFNFIWVNSAYARACRRAREEFIGHNHFEFYPHAENEAIFRRVRETRRPIEFREKPFVFPDQPERGVTYWDWTLTPIKDAKGRVQSFVFSLLDVTERVAAREKLLELERTRARHAETLAAEVNHRVKNNLAIIAGILSMQIDAEPKKSRAAELVRDAMTRIHTLASVHEQLYERPGEGVDILEAMRQIAKINCEMLSNENTKVAVAGDPVLYPSKEASTLCLVANELVTNAIKHGAPKTDGRLHLEIRVTLKQDKFQLSVWNSGNPVQEDSPRPKKCSLGLRLVEAMVVGEYGGTFTLHAKGDGSIAEITLSDKKLRGEFAPSYKI